MTGNTPDSVSAATSPEEFDLVIIGAGSGNTIPSPDLWGQNIAIVDDGRWFGGTCLNAGCIPTKMFVRPADIARAARESAGLGVRDASLRLDWTAVRDRVFGRIDFISNAGEQYRASGESNVTLVRESVRFTDTRELRTESGRTLRGKQIVIGAGSRPRDHEVLPYGETVFSSDDALRLERLPERLLVVGGGVVASEFAAIYSAFGVAVTQINRSELFRSLDEDVRKAFAREASRQWDVRTGVEIVEAAESESGWHIVLSDGTSVDVDAVLLATGRVPNTDRLDTNAAGFDQHLGGRLVVDEFQRVLSDGVPVEGVFALGDVSSPHQLKHVANEDARVVAENLQASIRGAELRANTLGPVPYTVFSSPEIATFGFTLPEANYAGHDAFEVRQDYGGTAWGWALEDDKSFCKLVVDRETGDLLGAHIIGPDAPILLQPLVQAASFGQSVRSLARGQYWPHPAATEIIENALLQAEEELNQ